MSAEVKTTMVQNLLMQSYYSEWTINRLSSMKSKNVATPIFSPIPGIDLQFSFDAWFQKVSQSKMYGSLSSFRLVLVKKCSANVPPSLRLKLNIIVNYSDGTLYREYESPTFKFVEEMTRHTCIDMLSELIDSKGCLTNHGKHMDSDSLVVKCHMTFCGHLCSPSLQNHEKQSLDNLRRFAKSFSRIYRHSSLSDFFVKVGEDTIPANRSVLAAQSSVLRKKIEENSAKGKTDSIIIEGFDLKVVEQFLKYFFVGEIEDKSLATVEKLYRLAFTYDVPTLNQECVEIISIHLDVNNIYDILKLAYDFSDDNLKTEAKKFSVCHFEELVTKKEWDALISSHPLIGYDILSLVHPVPVSN